MTVSEAIPVYNRRYTYKDYLKWDDDIRCELIDGYPYMMSAPTIRHQRLLGRMYVQFFEFLKGKKCEVFLAPFDVRLYAGAFDLADEAVDTVVQPDLIIICDEARLDKTGCKGAPDMAVEILSPSSTDKDKMIKYWKYLKAGVREYWIVDPDNNRLMVHLLEEDYQVIHTYNAGDRAPVNILPGCTIDLREVFE